MSSLQVIIPWVPSDHHPRTLAYSHKVTLNAQTSQTMAALVLYYGPMSSQEITWSFLTKALSSRAPSWECQHLSNWSLNIHKAWGSQKSTEKGALSSPGCTFVPTAPDRGWYTSPQFCNRAGPYGAFPRLNLPISSAWLMSIEKL